MRDIRDTATNRKAPVVAEAFKVFVLMLAAIPAMTLGHSDAFRTDGVTHRATQAVAFCKTFVGHRGLLFHSAGVMERL